MIREVLQNVSYGWLATAALLLFVLAFTAVSIKTWLTTKSEADQQADIPLSDGTRCSR